MLHSRLRAFTFLFFALLFAATADAQKAPPKYQGLLWEISGNGLSKPSYLYGTMHVSRKVAFHLSDSFFVAIRKVDVVALELDMEKWLDNNLEIDRAQRLKEFYGGSSSSSGFYRYALTPQAPEQKDLKALLRSSPSIINNMLYRTSSMRSDFEENTYLDHFIFQVGKKLNKKVIGIEDFVESRELSNRSRIPDEEDDEEKAREERERKRLLLRELCKNMSYTEALEDAYRRGDLSQLDSMQLLEGSQNHLQYLLYERNILMAERMDSVMKKSALFAGVGAAHLPGEKGVIELLRRKGYTLRPVSVTNNREITFKAEIDAIRFPVQFTKQYAADSAFSVELPHRFYETAADASSKDYICLDMANGSYYHIQRINHYGGLKGQGAAHILKRIDSLLYENIPGKIISKKAIEGERPGYDIVNKTSKGDVQRYNIFVTPEEIYVFKASGTDEYISSGPEAERFFSSISFRPVAGKPRRYEDAALGLRLDFPGQYTEYRHLSHRSAQQRYVTGFSPDGKNYCFFSAATLFDFKYLEEDTFELGVMSDLFARHTGLTLVRKQLLSWKQHPAMDAKFTVDGQEIYARLVLRGGHYFLAGCRGDSVSAMAFLNSLELPARKLSLETQAYEDTLFHCTVQTYPNPSPYDKLLEDRSSRTSEKKKEENRFLPVNITHVYTCPQNSESVSLSYRKLNTYFQMGTKDEFWNYIYDDLRNDKELHWHVRSRKQEGSFEVITGLLSDTGSTRGILVKMVQRCGLVYTLRTCIDTLEGPGPFAKKFFDSFQPKDTCIGEDVLKDKLVEFFFPKIYSADSTEAKQAKNAIRYVSANLEDRNVAQLIATIDDPRFARLENNEKEQLIRALGRRKSPDILPFLRKLYTRYTDSTRLQFAVLGAVALQHHAPGAETFLELLRTELPVTSKDSYIEGAFSPFFDSLRTAQNLFPGVLVYARFPEYRPTIYSLLAQLADSGFVKRKTYARRVEDILEDANYALKLYVSSHPRDEKDSRNPLLRNEYARAPRKGFVPRESVNDEQEVLLDYVTLLAPFYSDKNVRRFLDKVLTQAPEELSLVAAGQMLRSGMPVNDTIWTYYAGKRKTRALTYAVLEHHKKLDKMPAAQRQQEAMVQSLLLYDETKGKGDTVVLLDKVRVKNKVSEGYVYFYKWRPKDKRNWKLACTGVQPLEQNKLKIYPEVSRSSISFESDQQRKKEMENQLIRIRLYQRERTSSSDFETGARGGYSEYFDF